MFHAAVAFQIFPCRPVMELATGFSSASCTYRRLRPSLGCFTLAGQQVAPPKQADASCLKLDDLGVSLADGFYDCLHT